jgi:hypothetical protein
VAVSGPIACEQGYAERRSLHSSHSACRALTALIKLDQTYDVQTVTLCTSTGWQHHEATHVQPVLSLHVTAPELHQLTKTINQTPCMLA